MKSKNIILFAIAVVIFFVATNLNSQETIDAPPCGVDDCPIMWISDTLVHNTCTFDGNTNTYCCTEVTYLLTKHSPCPPLIVPYFRFKIISIEAVGDCYLTQAEVMDAAVKTILAAAGGHEIARGSISVPSCIKATSCDEFIMSSSWVDCGNGSCCNFNFNVGWDSLRGDLKLYSSHHSFNPNGTFYCELANPADCVTCEYNCSDTLFPDDGLLDLYSKLPEGCNTACQYSPDSIPTFVEYNSLGIRVSGVFSIGEDINGFPCLDLRYFWLHEGAITPEFAVELLIKQALSDYSKNLTLPINITVNVWKCIRQLYDALKIYIGCAGGCCEITFKVEFDTNVPPNTVVTEINKKPSPLPCILCTEICSDIFNSYPFLLEKTNISELDEYEPKDVKVIPNPTNGTFSIAFNTISKGTYALRITDLIGQEIYTSNLDVGVGFNNFEINLTNIANGVYYIQLIDNGQLITTTKFIKN